VTNWRCPPFRPPSKDDESIAFKLYSDLSHERGLANDPIESAGLELRAVLRFLHSGADRAGADNDYWRRKCRAVLLRPAIEPIAYTYWHRLSSFEIDALSALRVASALAGSPLVYRKGSAIGKSANGDVHFPPLDDQGIWLARIRLAACDPDLAYVLPALVFAQAVLTHPFSDGNGRFARLMVHIALGRCAGLDGPKIALAPAFYLRAESLGTALATVSDHGDWSAFYQAFFSTLSLALAATREVRRHCRG